MVESNKDIYFDEDSKTFTEEYFCFKYEKLYICSSQSGDMVPEYLELYGEIEIVY